MKTRSIFLGLILLVFSFSFFAFSSPAEAAVGLTIQPIKVSQTLAPGEAVSGTITLTNASEEAVEVSLKVEDFIPTAGAEGIQFVGRAPGVTTVRDWIEFGEESPFVFEKGAIKNIGYTITAPPNAEPGSHFGVLFFKANKLQEEGQLRVGTQVGVLVFVTVPGNYLQQGRLLEFSGPSFVQRPPVLFNIKFENTGTVHFEPKGAIEISNIFGREVGRVPIEGQVVLPTGVKEWVVDWRTNGFLLGRYTALAKIINTEGKVLASGSHTFYALPIGYTIGFLAAIIVIFIILRFVRRRVSISFSLKEDK